VECFAARSARLTAFLDCKPGGGADARLKGCLARDARLPLSRTANAEGGLGWFFEELCCRAERLKPDI
jgi:hypothetical protein